MLFPDRWECMSDAGVFKILLVIKTSIQEIQQLLVKYENILDSEFKNRHEFLYNFNDPEVYEMFLVMIKNIRDFRMCLKILKRSNACL